MKKTKLTRSLLAACSIVALSVALSGCLHSSDDPVAMDDPPPVDDDMDDDAMDDDDDDMDDGPTDEEIAAAATAAAATKATAIGVESRQGANDAGLGGSDAADMGAGSYTLEIEHGDVSVTLEGATNALDQEFMQAMDFGNGRTMHVLTMDADDDGNVVEEVAIVMTDIMADEPTPFGMRHTLTDADNTVDSDGDGTVDNDTDILTAAGIRGLTDTIAAGANLPLIGGFTYQSGQPVQTFANNDAGTPGDEAYETAGTYEGAPGTYRCDADAANCTVTFNAMGEISAISDGWIFTPAANAMAQVPDTAYLSYGFWLQRTTDAMGVVTYDEVETFAMATGYTVSDAANITDITGTASYSGSSVGVYVNNVLDGQGSIVSATSGHFLADVAIDASFGGAGVSMNNQHTISGTIDNFRLSGEEDNDWSVTLGLADFSGRTGEPGMSTPGTTFATDFDGTATGDAGAAAGSWSGMFHGSTADYDHDMDTDTPQINQQPSAVTGEFNANFTNGTAAGGFGATIDEE